MRRLGDHTWSNRSRSGAARLVLQTARPARPGRRAAPADPPVSVHSVSSAAVAPPSSQLRSPPPGRYRPPGGDRIPPQSATQGADNPDVLLVTAPADQQ